MSGAEPAERQEDSWVGIALGVAPGGSGTAISFGSGKSLASPVLLCEGAGVAERAGQRAWGSAGLQVRALLRPDGKWLVKLPEDHPEVWSRLIEQVYWIPA